LSNLVSNKGEDLFFIKDFLTALHIALRRATANIALIALLE